MPISQDRIQYNSIHWKNKHDVNEIKLVNLDVHARATLPDAIFFFFFFQLYKSIEMNYSDAHGRATQPDASRWTLHAYIPSNVLSCATFTSILMRFSRRLHHFLLFYSSSRPEALTTSSLSSTTTLWSLSQPRALRRSDRWGCE